ncbi:putative membrane transport protein [Lyophyllum shimeji]|uniref:Membrane transport protein n=1 Tax=Lyophyllum shimeji TaxID=47721 RepID=A0A9P3PV97_LYOSH|nr:putative membrane transport protein [Lyophyllum shimeji]
MGPEAPPAPLGTLLLTVFDSILEVFWICLAGYILAWNGILDKATQKKINRINVSWFTPALLFSKVAFHLTPGKFKELWIVPIFFLLVTAVSALVAFVLGWIFHLKKSQRCFAMAAAMFMNSQSLPIALMQSLVVSVPGLKWGKDDNKHAMLGRALTYLVLYSTLGMVLRWSIGVRLLAQADDPSIAQSDEEEEERPLLADHDHDASASTSTFVSQPADHHPPQPALPQYLRPTPRRRTTYYKSFPNSPNQSQSHLPRTESDTSLLGESLEYPAPGPPPRAVSTAASDDESSDASDDDARSPLPLHSSPAAQAQPPPPSEPAPRPPPSLFRRIKRRIVRFWARLNDFMTVPLWAALLSILVACIRPVQHTLETHVLSIKGAVTSAGNVSIPLTLTVLGAYFYTAPTTGSERGPSRSARAWGRMRRFFGLKKREESVRQPDVYANGYGNGAGNGNGYAQAGGQRIRREKTTGETKTVVIAVMSRMVITPLLIMPLIALSAKFDWQRVLEDPVFVLSNVLLVSAPPALTLAQITQAASGDAFERLISRTIFWSYCVLTPPAMVLYVVLGLVIARL